MEMPPNKKKNSAFHGRAKMERKKRKAPKNSGTKHYIQNFMGM
jgi:hypothetical protein